MKNTLKTSLILCGLLLAASMSFAQTILSHTTLSAAITSTNSQANTFRLTSTTGIVANSTMLYIDGEADFVNAVTSTTVSVTRGQPTSRVSTHLSGTLVWFGPPSEFYFQNPVGYPSGSCTRSQSSVLPYIDVNNSIISDCLGGVWVNGITTPLTPTVIYSPPSGGSVLTGVGTSTTTANTSMYCSEIDLPFNKLLTGLRALNGTAVGNGNRLVALYDAAGNLLANSATAGAATANASTYQSYAFTSQYFAVGPARYFGCSQAANSSDSLNLVVTADGNAGLLTQIYTGQTFGTIPTMITPSAAYTTAQGPYFAFY
jgi:hypothetical protein